MSAVDSPLLGWGTPTWDQSLVPLNVHSIAYANSIVVKTGPGLLYGFEIYSSKASAQWIQVFDATVVPGTGAIPGPIFTVAATSNLPVNWVPPRSFLNGCVIVNSTTGPTYTAGSADCWFDVQFL